MLPPVIVSSCFMGTPCRYDGSAFYIPQMTGLLSCCVPIPVCPELLAGQPIPRDPVEQVGERAVTIHGVDQTDYFQTGAQMTLRIARQFGARYALLKSGSPSCGSDFVYDGTFSGRLVNGMGFTAKLLSDNGIRVFSENNVGDLIALLKAGKDNLSPTSSDEEVAITGGEISAMISDIVGRLRSEIGGSINTVFVVVLNGALHMASDLLRELQSNAPVAYVSASSYKGGRLSNGRPELRWVGREKCEGADIVIVLDDIVDTGETTRAIIDSAGNPRARFIVASLLSKIGRIEGANAFIYGKIVEKDAFLYGYGMDDGERGRNINAIVRKGTIHDI